MRRVEMVGQVYGRLTVTAESGKQVTALCECGKIKDYLRSNILAGYTQSCGCFRDAQIAAANTTHGMTGSPTYVSWQEMKKRCDNPLRANFQRYGGRGISYDPAWVNFENFLRDMGERPEGKELDRKDNNEDYNKSNCRWVTHQANCMNRGY